MDVLITRDAALDFDVLNLLRPAPPAWGFLIGHKRGPRFFVERIFPAGPQAVLPSPGELDEIDRGFGRKVVGLFAVRPSAAFRRSVAGPYFYGRLVLDVRPSKNGPVLRPYVVELDHKFVLEPVVLRHGRKGERP
jgi:hypothetical protein